MQIPYRQCTRCVMDTSDPEITFDAAGVCNHCLKFDAITSKVWFPGAEGLHQLQGIIGEIKLAGSGQTYDSILGLSGGVDSSFLALKAREWGLRPLVVHVDAGWNSELAVANIEAVVKHCGYDLHTHVVDWEEMRDLQLAFLRSGVANQDVPQDHVFSASLYRFATRNGIQHVLSGGNIATESIFPDSWHASAMDAVNLKAIHRRFGQRRLRSFPTMAFSSYFVWYPFVKGMRSVRPLNYMPYNKAAAISELEAIGWRSYGHKHGESLFTKFFQNYYLPVRFGYDKRRPHLSSLIVSGQITREEALLKLREPLYDPNELESDMQFFCKKLKLTRTEFDELLRAPIRQASEFPNWNRRYRFLKKGQALFERLTGRRKNIYS